MTDYFPNAELKYDTSRPRKLAASLLDKPPADLLWTPIWAQTYEKHSSLLKGFGCLRVLPAYSAERLWISSTIRIW